MLGIRQLTDVAFGHGLHVRSTPSGLTVRCSHWQTDVGILDHMHSNFAFPSEYCEMCHDERCYCCFALCWLNLTRGRPHLTGLRPRVVNSSMCLSFSLSFVLSPSFFISFLLIFFPSHVLVFLCLDYLFHLRCFFFLPFLSFFMSSLPILSSFLPFLSLA